MVSSLQDDLCDPGSWHSHHGIVTSFIVQELVQCDQKNMKSDGLSLLIVVYT